VPRAFNWEACEKGGKGYCYCSQPQRRSGLKKKRAMTDTNSRPRRVQSGKKHSLGLSISLMKGAKSADWENEEGTKGGKTGSSCDSIQLTSEGKVGGGDQKINFIGKRGLGIENWSGAYSRKKKKEDKNLFYEKNRIMEAKRYQKKWLMKNALNRHKKQTIAGSREGGKNIHT